MPSRPPTLETTNEGSRILFCHLCEFEHMGHSSELSEPCYNCDQIGFITVKGDQLDDSKKKQIPKLRREIWG